MAMLVVAAASSYIGSAAAVAAGYSAGATVAFGMTGAQLGWMAGSMIASALMAPGGQDGPRIEDKRVQSNIYGQYMPIVYGTKRVSTQLVWASELHESSREEGGKGGGGVTVYSYSVDLLLSVCEAPKTPIRIWANGRLLYKNEGFTVEVDEELIQPENIRILMGEEDQVPDPVYEAAVTTADAVAYRGQLTIMLEGLQLEAFGNRPPTIDVEVTDGTTSFTATYEVLQNSFGANWASNHSTWDYKQKKFVAFDALGNLTIVDPGINFLDPVIVPGVTSDRTLFTRHGSRYMLAHAIPVLIGRGVVLDSNWWSHVFYNDPGASDFSVGADAWFNPKSGGEHFWWAGPVQFIDSDFYSPGDCGYLFNASNGFGEGMAPRQIRQDDSECTIDQLNVSTTGAPNFGAVGEPGLEESGANKAWWSFKWGYVGANSIFWELTSGANIPNQGYSPSNADGSTRVYIGGISVTPITGAAGPGIIHQRRKNRIWMHLISNGVPTLQHIIPKGEDWSAGFQSVNFPYPESYWGDGAANVAIAYHEKNDWLVFAGWDASIDGYRLTAYDPEELIDATTEARDPVKIAETTVPNNTPGSNKPGIIISLTEGFADEDYAVFYTNDGTGLIKFTWAGGLTRQGITLGEIVEDICVRAGLRADQIDRSTLTDIVDGYSLTRQSSGRSAIDPLRNAWFFDAVESGLVYKWVKRGSNPIATINMDDMAVHEYKENAEPDPYVEVEHINELEVPKELSLTYVDYEADYDPGIQTARRQATGSLTVTKLDLPIVLSADYAARVAWTNLLHAHAGKDNVKFILSHEFEHLEPTDSVWIPFSNGELRRALIMSKVSARPKVEFEGVLEDVSIYGILFEGTDREQGPRQEQPGFTAQDSQLLIMDIPPIRDTDDKLLLYTVSYRTDYAEGWNGATAFKSTTATGTYTAIQTFENEGVVGHTESLLDPWYGGNIFDRVNTVKVKLYTGALSSSTELEVLNGANIAYVGGELIQFVNATLIGTNLYELDTLLRYRRGTDYGLFLSRPVNSPFALLTPSTVKAIFPEFGEYKKERFYKSVSKGQPISDVASQGFTSRHISITPLPVTDVRGVQSGNDWTVTWIRRARVNAEWIDGIDVPLDESLERYTLQFLRDSGGGTLVWSPATHVVDDATTFTYTAAMQMSEWGSYPSDLYVYIWQHGDEGLLGYPTVKYLG